ncbi:hypothetical protein VTG60DRAFT_4158 [Thermothelomyces hinnuleus]
MRWPLAALLGSALVARQALANLTFTVEATRNGVPIPASEIRLEPFEPGRTRMGPVAEAPRAQRKTRRSNAQADSANWCGSVNMAPSGTKIQLAHGSFQHPSCYIRPGYTFPQAAASWVGIDGDTYRDALLQAGTVCKIDNSTGVVRHEAWWQWVPSAAFTIASMPVAPDDWFEVTLNTTSTTSAEITISNLSQGQTYSIRIQSGPVLARVDVDWVVERPYYGTTLAGFPTFTDVWFEDARATLVPGGGGGGGGWPSQLGVQGAKQYQIPDLCASQEWQDSQEVSWSL